MSQKVEIHPHYAQVASQCLQSAYALNTEDKHLAVSKPLQAIFQEATKNEPVGSTWILTTLNPFSPSVAKEVAPLRSRQGGGRTTED